MPSARELSVGPPCSGDNGGSTLKSAWLAFSAMSFQYMIGTA